jgi:hypothetical protein
MAVAAMGMAGRLTIWGTAAQIAPETARAASKASKDLRFTEIHSRSTSVSYTVPTRQQEC